MSQVNYRAPGYRPLGSAVRSALMHLLSRSKRFNWLAQSLGDVADYANWLESNFPKAPRFRTREQVFLQILRRLDDTPTHVYEFGVAWGYVPNWFLPRCSNIVRWHGYDRFLGLPEEWRHLSKGSLSADGKVPEIADERAVWHVGDIPDVFANNPIQIGRPRGERVLVFFDLDLYEPTAAAWREIRPYLRPGDIIWFDEAVDGAERRVLNEEVLKLFQCDVVGCTYSCLALEIVSA